MTRRGHLPCALRWEHFCCFSQAPWMLGLHRAGGGRAHELAGRSLPRIRCSRGGKPLLSLLDRDQGGGAQTYQTYNEKCPFTAALSFLCQVPHLPSQKGWPMVWDLTDALGASESLNLNTFFRERRDLWLSSELIHLLNGNVKAWQTLLLMSPVLRYSWAANSRPHENGFCQWNHGAITL